MYITGWNTAARPAVTTPGDIYEDLSTGKKSIYTVEGTWADYPAPAPIMPTDYASPDKAGVIKVGTGLSINAGTGKLSANAQLPTVTAEDAGKVLTVTAAGVWDDAPAATELPAVTTEDAGKVLTVSAEGAWVAATHA